MQQREVLIAVTRTPCARTTLADTQTARSHTQLTSTLMRPYTLSEPQIEHTRKLQTHAEHLTLHRSTRWLQQKTPVHQALRPQPCRRGQLWRAVQARNKQTQRMPLLHTLALQADQNNAPSPRHVQPRSCFVINRPYVGHAPLKSRSAAPSLPEACSPFQTVGLLKPQPPIHGPYLSP